MDNIFFHPKALAELNDAALSLNNQVPELGDEFLTAVEQSVWIVSRFPDTWPCVRNDIRRIIVPRFNYHIFYRLRPGSTIEIIAVMHPRRKPFNFIDRV